MMKKTSAQVVEWLKRDDDSRRSLETHLQMTNQWGKVCI